MIRSAMNHTPVDREEVSDQYNNNSLTSCFRTNCSRRSASTKSLFDSHSTSEIPSVSSPEIRVCSRGQIDEGAHDAQLVERVLAGDQKAVLLFIERLSPLIYGCIKRLDMKNRSCLYEERDFMQDIWARLFLDNGRILKQYDFRRSSRLEHYFFMVIHRELGNLLQKEHASKRGLNITFSFEENDDSPMERATPEHYLEARELAAHLDQHLQSVLPERGMEVWRTYFLEGAVPSEIAEELNVSVQVIYNWLHKIRLLCREFKEYPVH